jgi:prolyl-tRNA editing enzyme YbaK/EbsC (Cys-tRNA(Pro) deacylase)
MLTRAGKLLAEHGFSYREYDQEDRNENVCKTIMFKRKDGVKIAALVPFTKRVSYKKLKAHYNQDVSPLSPAELRAEGFEPHECAPMLMKCELLVDPECLEKEPIRTGSGTLGYGIEWHIADLEKIKQYKILDLQEIKP